MATVRKKKVRTTTAAHDEKKLEIIEHCAHLFDKVGYHRATMQMLADEVGLGKPTLYHYFPSKTDILFEMHQMHIDAMLGSLDGADDKTTDHAQLLINACTYALREIAQHPGYVRAFMDHYAELEGKQRAEIRTRRQEYYNRIRGIISGGIAKGKFRKCDPDLATLTFLGICNWAYKWYPRMAAENPPEKMAVSLTEMLIEGLKR